MNPQSTHPLRYFLGERRPAAASSSRRPRRTDARGEAGIRGTPRQGRGSEAVRRGGGTLGVHARSTALQGGAGLRGSTPRRHSEAAAMGEVTVPSMEEEAITALPEQDTGTGNVGLIWEAAISDAAGSFDYNFLDLNSHRPD